MKKKLPEINVYTERSVHTYEYGRYEGDNSSSTFPTRKSTIEFSDNTQVFEDDEHEFKAIRFVNNMFASDKIAKINSELEKCSNQIKKIEQKMTKLMVQKKTYLVPVKIHRSN